MSDPQRIQLSRTKGWRMPENTVRVARPSKWGNPFVINVDVDAGAVVAGYRSWLFGKPLPFLVPLHALPAMDAVRREVIASLALLRGKNLACWCKPGAPCHADVLLELANADPAP